MNRLWLLIFILLNVARATPASATEAQNLSCKKYVQSFYDWYMAKCEDTKTEDPSLLVFKNKSFAFSKELETKLKEDDSVAALFPGEIVGLDFDPFLNAQDVATKYTVEKITNSAEKFRADVFNVYNGTKSSKPVVIPELIFQNGKWVFVNFIYPGASRAENQNLLSTLDQIKKNRPPLPKGKTGSSKGAAK